MNEPQQRRITSLGELPRELAPSRDLWREIEARLKADARAERPVRRLPRMRELAAAAALIVAVAVGVGIGRVWSPPGHTGAALPAAGGAAGVLGAAYVTDPRYLREREALLAALPAQIEALPPKSRAKVAASLAAIRQSIEDIQAALGRDPGNALLQEMLVNTFQDEMRVLTEVQDASNVGREI